MKIISYLHLLSWTKILEKPQIVPGSVQHFFFSPWHLVKLLKCGLITVKINQQILFFLLFWMTNKQESVCRMVLGSHNCSSGSRCTSRGIWGGFFGTWQQPPSVHVDPLGQDCARSHQYTDPIQQCPVFAWLQFPSPAQTIVLPQRAQPGAILHGTKEESRGGESGGGGGSIQTPTADNPGHISAIKTKAGCLQAPKPPLLTAPHPPRH